jgi:WD40 repeat protein
MFSRHFVRSALVMTVGSVWLKRKMAISSPRFQTTYKHSSSVHLESPVLSAAPIADSTLATGDWFGTIGIIGPDSKSNSKSNLQQPRAVMSIAKLTDTTFATSEQSRIRVWDHQREVREFGPDHSATISDMVGFSNGLLAVVRWGSENVQIWDSHTGNLKWSLTGHTDDVKYVAKLSQNRLASYAWDHTIRIWNLDTGECERAITSGYSGALAALPDDRLVTTNIKGIQLWADGECVKNIAMPDLPWNPSLAVTPDGKLLVTTFKTAFRAVDLEADNTQDVYSFMMPDEIVCMPDGRVFTFGPGRDMSCFQPL